MARWLLVVESNCTDPAREAEFNEWYDRTHLPDILETPGFVKATRYELVPPVEGKAKFIAAYEIEASDIDAAMATHQENMARKRGEGRFTDLSVLVSRGIYKQISRLPE